MSALHKLDADTAVERLHALGFYCMEIEVVPNHVSVFVWRKYERGDGFSTHASTLSGALSAAVHEGARREPVAASDSPKDRKRHG